MWKLDEEVAKQLNCKRIVASNVVNLLEKGNSVPFIARYRRDLTECMEPEKIREVKEKMEELKEAENLALKAIKIMTKSGKINPGYERSILTITDSSILKDLVSSLKPEGRKSKFKAALDLPGLAELAGQVLNSRPLNIDLLVRAQVKGLSNYEEALENFLYVLADIISKKEEALDFVIKKCKETNRVFVISKKINSKKVVKQGDVEKFKEYFDFRIPMVNIKPYKYLAMKRGESLKILKTSLELEKSMEGEFVKIIEKRLQSLHKTCLDLVRKASIIAYEKIVMPQILAKLRNDLRKVSEDASVKVFCTNLKHLLLTSPVRNRHILGVDPGYRNGCKFALIGPSAEVLETGVLYISHEVSRTPSSEFIKIKSILLKHRCEIIAIGNGTGCRQAEKFFSMHNKLESFKPLKIMYSIIFENGASEYSVSDLATKELPEFEVTLRGAVSIARRLQDPLAEMIKIEPKHLGIGMYQHDISEKKLKVSLDGVVEDCVSLVGVDINSCNEHILQHIAGLGPVLARNIILKRNELGGFRNRHQLLRVKGLGENKFLQCAGFLKISLPDQEDDEYELKAESMSRKRKPKSEIHSRSKRGSRTADECVDDEIDLFDRTTIHPESYELASKLLKKVGLAKSDIGRPHFIDALSKFMESDLSSMSGALGTCMNTLQQIVESLKKVQDYDIRDEHSQPVFRSSVTEMKDIQAGQNLTGRVTNVTDFGAFVDIGVETDGFIHKSAIPQNDPCFCLGTRLFVQVLSIDTNRKRISLRLSSMPQ